MADAIRPHHQETLVSSIAKALLVMMSVGIIASAAIFGDLIGSLHGLSYVDFDAFHLVGRMTWHGTLTHAYSIDNMFAAEAADAHTATQMPWTYPPQFDLIVALLALVNKGLAYLLFIGASFAAYLWVLRRLAGPHFDMVLIATAPALLVCILAGQNGFLTGALVGAFALATLRGRRVAGVPLGLMVIKPHLAVGLAVMVLARRGWGVLALAALVTLASAAVSTLAFGPGIWAAFLGGVRESSVYLQQGAYPMYRMTSLYAAARSFNIPADASFALQMVLALAACATTAYPAIRRWPVRQQVGMALLCTLAISPYNYDYDMPIFGLAAALLATDVIPRATRWEQALLLALGWLSGGWWIIFKLTHPTYEMNQDHIVTVSGLAYALLIAQTVMILHRAAVPARDPLAAAPTVA